MHGGEATVPCGDIADRVLYLNLLTILPKYLPHLPINHPPFLNIFLPELNNKKQDPIGICVFNKHFGTSIVQTIPRTLSNVVSPIDVGE